MSDEILKKKAKKPVSTDNQVLALKAKDKPYTEKVGDGLQVYVNTNGAKHWHFRYTFNHKPARISIGEFPVLLISDAKQVCLEYNRLVAKGIDPRDHRIATKREEERNGLLFQTLAEEWLQHRKLSNKDTHEDERRLKADVYPKIGQLPVISIDLHVLEDQVFKPLVNRGVLESARRIKTTLKQIFAVAKKRKVIPENPVEDVLLPSPVRGHHAALTEPHQIAPMLRAMWAYCERGTPVVSNALILAVLVFVRPVELRFLKWTDINFDEGLITIIFAKQHGGKLKKETLWIPMASQAIAILEHQRRFVGDSPYVFPAQKSHAKIPVISENTLGKALKVIGYSGLQTHHGFRATAATILSERLKMDYRYIELQLSHKLPDSNNGAYHRATWFDERKEMMQAWADYLDELRLG